MKRNDTYVSAVEPEPVRPETPVGAALLTWLALAIAGSELRYVALGIGALFACVSVGVTMHSAWWLSR